MGVEEMSLQLRVVLVLSLFAIGSFCGNIEWDSDRPKLLEEDETIRIKIGLIPEYDAVIGDDPTTLSIDQWFHKEPDEESGGHVEVLIYHSEFADKIGYVEADGTIQYCCTPTLHQSLICPSVGYVIVSDDALLQKEVSLLRVNLADTISQLDFHTSSGMYYIKYFNCHQSGAGTVHINGTISWMNPFGNLSAELYPFVWFFALMTIFYLVIGVIWMILSAIYWNQLLVLQNCIAGVIFLGMVECITWYFDFLSYNIGGEFNWVAISIGVFSSTVKRTVSRLLVLVVSMGFGVVKATLGTSSYQVFFLGGLYFVVSLTQQLILTYLREGESEFLNFLATVIIFPAALLDTIFYWWIFLSLSRTIQQLTLRKQEVKLRMYTSFLYVLIGSGFVTVAVIIYQTILIITSSEDAMWNTWWIFQAFWHLLYFTIMLAIAFLWRPTTNNTRYAYKEADDIELNLISKSGGKSDIEIPDALHLDLDDDDYREELNKLQ